MGNCINLIMFTVFAVGFSLFIVALTGLTIATLVTKKESEKLIKEELGNMFEITKMLLLSIKNLVRLLIKTSCTLNLDESIEETQDNVVAISDKQQEDTKVA